MHKLRAISRLRLPGCHFEEPMLPDYHFTDSLSPHCFLALAFLCGNSQFQIKAYLLTREMSLGKEVRFPLTEQPELGVHSTQDVYLSIPEEEENCDTAATMRREA
jgi:hypothetical protein